MNADAITIIDVDANLPVGVKAAMEYSQQKVIIQPHTIIFLYTDELTEAKDIEYQQFGEEGIKRVAQQLVDDSSDEWLQPNVFVRKMEKAVSEFVGKAEQSDDLTMLAIRLK